MGPPRPTRAGAAPPPPPPAHERAADWLAAVCGGRAAVESLDATPLTDDAIDLPVEYELTSWRHRMESTAEILDSVATRDFDAETSYAFRHALLALWADDPENAMHPATPAHLAGGICWAVGKANGLFHPVGPRRVGATQQAFGLRTPLAAPAAPSPPPSAASVRTPTRGVDRRAHPTSCRSVVPTCCSAPPASDC